MYLNNERFTDEEFNLFRDLIMKKVGIYYADSKKILIYSRLRSRVKELGLSCFKEYYNYIMKDFSGKELIYITNKLTTNYTYFMRENSHFEFLIKTAFPKLEKSINTFKKVKIWCAGCSTGEEPYILAMYVNKYFAGKNIKIEIIASDISRNALNVAKRGVYELEKVSKVPEEFIFTNFMRLNQDEYAVRNNIKQLIKFSYLNLNGDDFSVIGTPHIIFCRNVMIYFDNPTKEKLINKFYDITDDNGYLIISHSESLNSIKSKYKLVSPSIYVKN